MSAPPVRFGDRARTLYGLAVRTLGWTPGAFWSATPAELTDALIAPDEPASPTLDRPTLMALMERDNER